MALAQLANNLIYLTILASTFYSVGKGTIFTHMKLTTFLSIVLFFIFESCTPKIRETIVDVKSGEIIGGYTKQGYFPLSKGLRKEDFKNIDENDWRKRGLSLFFNYDETQMLRGIEIEKTQEFMTKRGLKPGDSIEKARKIYGKPWKKSEINYEIGGENYFLCNAWLYKGLTIYYESSGQINAIGVGKNIYLD
ncbi:MAG: hypothetical protein Q7T20_06645 [Saprospiraceae bacterium]|nr:hypothetical protein [Saprospiraceae bacterium]